jgi:hypothetical protein
MARYEFIDQPQQQQEETGLGTIGRGIARTGARVGEAVVGLPGDIVSGIAGLANSGSQLLTGSEIPGVSSLQKVLPTSQNIREYGTKSLTGEYLEPRSGTESTLDTLVGDIASLLTPGGFASKGASITGKAIGKAAARAAVGGVVGKGVGEFAGDTAGAIAKGLTLGLSSTYGGRKALDAKRHAVYQEATAALSDRNVIRNPGLQRTLVNDIQKVTKGVSPERRDILKVLKGAERNFYGIKEKIKPDLAYAYEAGPEGAQIKAPKAKIIEGNIKVQDLWNLKKNINEWLGDPDLAKGTKQQLGKTLSDLNKELAAYSIKNPTFGVPYNLGEELTKAIKPSTELRNLAEKNITFQNALKHWQPLSFAGYVATKGLGIPVGLALKTSGVGAGLALGGKEAIKLGELLAKSPHARKYYLAAAKEAGLGNAAAAAKNLKAFDQAAYQYEQANPAQEQQQAPQARYEIIG